MTTVIPRIEPARSTIEGACGALQIVEIRLGGAPRGAVVLLGDADLSVGEVADIMNRLAEHGFASVAADLSGRGSDAGVLDDVATLLAELTAQGWSHEQIGLIGYGFGGSVAVLAAGAFELGAAVSVSPRAVAARPAEAGGRIRTPWLGLLGQAPPDVPIAAALAALSATALAYVSVVSYPTEGRLYRDSGEWDEHAAVFDAWQRTVEWLNLRVAPSLTPYAQAWRAKHADPSHAAP